MSEQNTAAAERSAHVSRGPAATEGLIWPAIEISKGVWKLRRVAELEAELEAVRAQRELLWVALKRLTNSMADEPMDPATAEAWRQACAALGAGPA